MIGLMLVVCVRGEEETEDEDEDAFIYRDFPNLSEKGAN